MYNLYSKLKKYGINSYGDKNYCYCNNGYEWNSSQTACIKIENKEANIIKTEPSPIPKKPTSSSQDINEGNEENLVSVDEQIQERNQQQVNNEQKSEQKKSFFMFLASILDTVKNFFSWLLK